MKLKTIIFSLFFEEKKYIFFYFDQFFVEMYEKDEMKLD